MEAAASSPAGCTDSGSTLRDFRRKVCLESIWLRPAGEIPFRRKLGRGGSQAVSPVGLPQDIACFGRVNITLRILFNKEPLFH